MNPVDVKTEKANAVSKYRRVQRITTLFRFIEMLVFLIVISRFSFEVPVAVGGYFRGISFPVFSPKHVFVIGNAIVLILFLKSRAVGDGDGKVDFYDEYVRRCENSVVNSVADKATVSCNKKRMCRSRSEDTTRVKCKDDETHRKLRRSVTERRRSEKSGQGGGTAEKSYAEDELSCDDFRRTVEAFIARQQKIVRDEEFAPMVYVGP